MNAPAAGPLHRMQLVAQYREVRAQTERLCEPLAVDDYQVQSVLETSPPKWHLAHASWFFETFLLKPFARDYRPFHPDFEYLFNSYYETVGSFHPRAQRGLLSRPTVEDVYRYRAARGRGHAAHGAVDPKGDGAQLARVDLGLHHEQQHQELLLMDIKHNFALNPLQPAYRELPQASRRPHSRRCNGSSGRAASSRSATPATASRSTTRRRGTRNCCATTRSPRGR